MFAMTMAGDGIGAAGLFNGYLRPDDPGGDFDGCHLRYGDALLSAAEQMALNTADVKRGDDYARREKHIAPGPTAFAENFAGRCWSRGHISACPYQELRLTSYCKAEPSNKRFGRSAAFIRENENASREIGFQCGAVIVATQDSILPHK